MIVAFSCGLFYGALLVWRAWTRRENVRRYRAILETLRPSEPEWTWYDRPVASTLSVEERQGKIIIDRIPYSEWMELFDARCLGCCDG